MDRIPMIGSTARLVREVSSKAVSANRVRRLDVQRCAGNVADIRVNVVSEDCLLLLGDDEQLKKFVASSGLRNDNDGGWGSLQVEELVRLYRPLVPRDEI